jgi:nicotinate-nucleotide pyrophosphorylase (carboxylating)
MREAVTVRDGLNPAVRIEASGGLTLESARAGAETGVDYISTSKITQAAPPVDIGLDD